MTFKKGMIPWNKGKKLPPLTEEQKKKLSERNKRLGIIPPSNKGKHHTEETKRKISESEKGKVGLRGEKHPNWKGGISLEYERLRHSLEYEIWRNEVYKRDYWTCRLCGYKGKQIVAHHIKLFSDFPELRFSVDNGITLCRNCHARIHKLCK